VVEFTQLKVHLYRVATPELSFVLGPAKPIAELIILGREPRHFCSKLLNGGEVEPAAYAAKRVHGKLLCGGFYT